MSQELPTIKNELEPVTLQEITKHDISKFIEMEKKVAGKTYTAWTTEKMVTEGMKRGRVYFIKDGENVVGHVYYQIKNGSVLSLDGIVTDPQYEGKGFAKQALEQIFKNEKGISAVELTVHPDNERAMKLYTSLGFKEIQRRENFYGDGQPRVILRKEK